MNAPIPLHHRSDLLLLIERALTSGTDQERKDLLGAALERIKALNVEYDNVCESRQAVQITLDAMKNAYDNMRDFAIGKGLDVAATFPPK